MRKLAILAMLSLACTGALAQGAAVSYSLPRTVLSFDVEAVRENFTAGPYAAYAKKYLGVDAGLSDKVSYSITSVRLTAWVEADQSERYSYVVNPSSQPVFLQLTSQGLVSGPAGSYSTEKGWKYPVGRQRPVTVKGVPANLAERTTTLVGEGGRMVQQSVILEKSDEAKAKEVADKIFEIRENKYKILVGDTDATYSGEAMKATIDALDALESDYLALFVGRSSRDTQSASFEVIPDKGDPQMYVAFRVSDEDGLVSADNVSGRPYIVELGVEQIAPVPAVESKAKPVQVVHYRIPSVCEVRLGDGITTLLQTRVPVYQLGITAEYPIYKTK